ncbi:MAG: ATP-binding protein [Deltaproteobacteria bacterium]|nr:ATP-binding protein [Deltaproteobacteria bacterium]
MRADQHNKIGENQVPDPDPDGYCSPDCPECGGVGYIRCDLPVGHPKFGKVERCPRANAQTFVKSVQGGTVDPRIGLTSNELRDLSWTMVRKGVNQADRACEVTQQAYITGHGLVFLYGGFGQGKSLVLKIAVAAALSEGRRAAYANLAGILDDVRTAYDERENKMTELVRRMEWWISQDVLAIDELDKVGKTDWARDRIFQLLDARYQSALRQEALTVIAANVQSTDELSGYLKSRIEDNRFTANGYLVSLNGTDGRRSMPKYWKY